MAPRVAETVDDQLLYPDSDGRPIADNTLQFQWIVTIEGCLEGMFLHDDNVFVAGDLLWYAVEGEPRVRTAPDVMIAFGRPKGYRGSYKQWVERGIAPQVVFEILSPSTRKGEMAKKFKFYERHGVEEYDLYDPDNIWLKGFRRINGKLQAIELMDGWISPRLGIRFDLSGSELIIWQPNGERFLTNLEQGHLREKETQRAERLAARLRELGIDPDTIH